MSSTIKACPENTVLVNDTCREFAPVFSNRRVGTGNVTGYIDPAAAPVVTVAIGDNFRIAPFQLLGNSTVSSGTVEDVQFSLIGAPPEFFINSASGVVVAQFTPDDNGKAYNIAVVATDASGLTAVAEQMSFRAEYRDTDVASNGPNG